MRRALGPKIAPSPGASRVRCGPTHAHKTRRSMREVSTESLAVTTLLTKRHANIGCERYPPIRALSNRDTQWGGREQTTEPSARALYITSNDVHRIIQNKLTKNAKLPGRANETAFMRRALGPKIAPSPGASRVRCGPTHAHKTRRSMREVSTESLAVTTLLTKRHANIGCERYPQTSCVVH